MLRALKLCPLDKVKVVVLGQDPYHGSGQANGLAFAVNSNMRIPPSLRNILSEVERQIGSVPNRDLLSWAKQGVLLLNTSLTVEEGKPGSHEALGWPGVTDELILQTSLTKSNLVFLLWGAKAGAKTRFIDSDKHLVLQCGHPSPFSVTRFMDNGHFTQTNQYLRKHGKSMVNWGKP